MSTIKVDTIQNTSGVQQYLAKAWLSYSQTTTTNHGSGNISSVTDNATGNYTLNFSTAMTSTGYNQVVGTGGTTTVAGQTSAVSTTHSTDATRTTTALQLITTYGQGSGKIDSYRDGVVVVS